MKNFTFLFKTLLLACLLTAWGGAETAKAQIELDFTSAASDWGFPSSTSAGAAIVGTETSFTNGTYTVYLYGASGNGCYANSGYIMICNNGSYIKLQAFDFAVSRIEVDGHSGASSAATMNVYVGETAVSTEVSDASVDHIFDIDEDYQAAGNEYIYKNTSSRNVQLSKIIIYPAGVETADWERDGNPITSAIVHAGKTLNVNFVTDADGEVTYTSSDTSVATISDEGVITGVAEGEATITGAVGDVSADLTVTVWPEAGGLETFENGGFESWSSTSSPEAWVSHTTASNATLSQSTDAYEGTYSVNIGHNSSSNRRLASKEYILPAGTYVVSYYAKPATSGTPADIETGYVPLSDDLSSVGTYVYSSEVSISDDEWTNVTWTFTLEKETELNLVIMNHSGSGYGAVLVDNYTISLATGTISISSVGYATYYTNAEYTMPDGLVGTTITGVNEGTDDADFTLTMPWEYTAGTTVPAGTALVLQGDEGTYSYAITSTGEEAVSGNLLYGSESEVTTYVPDATADNYYFYKLADGEDGLGFYWDQTDGAPYTSGANKAWLAILKTEATNVKFLSFGSEEDGTTGIQAVSTSHADSDAIYTLQGVRVNNMNQKGVYIVGGKKIIVK